MAQNTPLRAEAVANAHRQVAVVTGATSGIGRHIACGLAAAGYHVILVGRDGERGRQVIGWINTQHQDAALELRLVDLSLLENVRRLAGEIASSHPAISILVNNAGGFATRRRETAEGHESVLALNHLSPFVLTRALLPALRAAPGARVVNIGSSTADRARIDPDDLEARRNWGMVRAYSQSKLALTMATLSWAERLAGSGVSVNVVHPGAVATSLVRAGGVVGLAWRAMAPFLLTEAQGAETPLYAALSPDIAEVTGAYLKRRRAVRPNPLALDPALRCRVWQATEALTAGMRAAGTV